METCTALLDISTEKRLNKQRWGRVCQKLAVARNSGYCEWCGKPPNGHRLEAHHLQPLACGGKNVPWNVVMVCDMCHFKAHINNLTTKEKRMLERIKQGEPRTKNNCKR